MEASGGPEGPSAWREERGSSSASLPGLDFLCLDWLMVNREKCPGPAPSCTSVFGALAGLGCSRNFLLPAEAHPVRSSSRVSVESRAAEVRKVMPRWRTAAEVMVLILGGLTAFGSSNSVLEGPQNATVLKGSEARFNCTVSPGWKLIMWALKGTVVLSITPQGPIITNDRITSANYDVDGNFISEMIIRDVQPSDAGPVTCSLQNSDLFGSAFLSVQVMGTLDIPGDSLMVTEGEPCNVTCHALGWTPLPEISWEVQVPVSHSSDFSLLEAGGTMSILTLTPLGSGTLTCMANLKSVQASKSLTVNLTVGKPPPDSIDKAGSSLPTWAVVLLAVSLSLLLILIIVLVIIFCCCYVPGKENKESSYQNEIRKSANQNTSKAVPEMKLKSGKENYGYSSHETRTAQTASLPPKSHEVSILDQRSSSLPYQDPDKQRLGTASHPQVSFDAASLPRQVRNVTLV